MKRVYCLYRVSTMGQVEKDDIQMQREACNEFAKAKGWLIAEEFSEKGISGFKVSSDNREVLQSIKRAAVQKCFDVLLVFMFDRLGRRDDETPFIVEWFVKNGIEVWSVVEGEQRFEDHIDKLLNYIRYWQASGESIKTSLRTKTRMEQLAKEGLYTGGTIAYGYQLQKLGRVNKKGHQVHDILVEPNEAEVVKEIFRLYCSREMGTYRIASHLTKQGILNRRNQPWDSGTILSMIKNITYTGVLKAGNSTSDNFSHLRIIDDHVFIAAQKMVDENKISPPRGARSRYRSLCLFADVIYCTHCGKRMTVTCDIQKRFTKKGVMKTYQRLKYYCSNRKKCDGQRNYSINTIDAMLQANIEKALVSTTTETSELIVYNDDNIHEKVNEQKIALERETQILHDLKNEVVEVIRGTSAFGSVLINDLIRQAETNIIKLEDKITDLHDKQKKQVTQKNTLLEIGNGILLRGAGSFAALPLATQQEIINNTVTRVYIGRGYQYRIEWAFGGISQGCADI